MRRPWLGFIGAACLLAAGGCTTGSSSEAPHAASPACIKACDAAYDACSLDCENHVDNNLCSRECIDKLDSCKQRCE